MPLFIQDLLARRRAAKGRRRLELSEEQFARMRWMMFGFLIVWIGLFVLLWVEWTAWSPWAKYPLMVLLVLIAPDRDTFIVLSGENTRK